MGAHIPPIAGRKSRRSECWSRCRSQASAFESSLRNTDLARGFYFCPKIWLMKVGFVNIFGRPNAGKSTLLNALLGEKLAIVSSKVQTTRHRIKGFLTEPGKYQIILSDTPGIIEPKYKLQEHMMRRVKDALEDADLALLLVDINDDLGVNDGLFASLRLKVPALVVLNKMDDANPAKLKQAVGFFSGKNYCRKPLVISALKKLYIKELLETILYFLPEGEPFYDEEDLTDLPTRFFISEIIR